MKKRPPTAVTSKHLQPLLQKALSAVERQRKTRPDSVLKGVGKLLREPFLSQTKALRFADGVLYIAVSNSTILSALEMYEKKRLLSQLQSMYPASGIRSICFRLSGAY